MAPLKIRKLKVNQDNMMPDEVWMQAMKNTQKKNMPTNSEVI